MHTPRALPPPRRPWLIAASAVIGIGVVVAANAHRRHPEAPVVVAAPTPTPPPSEELVVGFDVPPDATVEIDGVVQPPGRTRIELRGAPGTTRRVSAARGSVRADQIVAITSSGAVPAAMTLAAPAPAPSTAPSARAVAAPAHPVSIAKPSTKPADKPADKPVLHTTFE